MQVPFRLPGYLVTALVALLMMNPEVQAQAKKKPNPAFAPVEDQPGLPRVLIIGDSISIGYTIPLQELLKGKANVHRIPTNGGPTTNGLKNIDKWLGDGHWDVIHFNWGLHDIKYMNDKGDLVSPEQGHQQVPIDEYQANLTKLVERLEKTGAQLIWRNTTPVPEGSAGRVPSDEVKYNAVAAKIMQAHNIPTDDQYSFVQPQMNALMLPKNVHFTPEGYRALAGEAAKSIEAALPAAAARSVPPT